MGSECSLPASPPPYPSLPLIPNAPALPQDREGGGCVGPVPWRHPHSNPSHGG